METTQLFGKNHQAADFIDVREVITDLPKKKYPLFFRARPPGGRRKVRESVKVRQTLPEILFPVRLQGNDRLQVTALQIGKEAWKVEIPLADGEMFVFVTMIIVQVELA
jgi:hypothetical protein